MSRLLIAASVAVLALSGLVAGKHAEERRLRTEIAGHVACQDALVGTDLTASATRCPHEVQQVHRGHRQAIECDRSLGEASLFGIRMSCSAPVKSLLAARDAESARANDLAGQLTRERADRAAAITRAEIRARTEVERTARADAALQAAPRDGDGRLVLDADRLRQLAQGPAADPARP